ncbi:MAG TPA: hypothetical protein ENN58_00495, partial [bacterium]|nr:hypothetical protein [bacterium]
MKKHIFLPILIGFVLFSCGNYTTKHFLKVPDNDNTLGDADNVSDDNDDEKDKETEDFENLDSENDIEVSDDTADEEIFDDEEESDEKPFIPIAICGNDKVEGSEICDGNTIECTELGYISGTAYCKSNCSGWNTVTCHKECEDGTQKCDGSIVVKCVTGKFEDVSDCSEKSKICRGGRCIDPNETDPRLDFEGPVFSGDKVLVYHYSTNGNTTNSSGTFTTVIPFAETQSYNIPDFLRTDLRPPLPGHLEIPSIVTDKKLKTPAPMKSFSVGEKDTFYVYDFQTNNNNATIATLKHIGTHCEIWVEDAGQAVADSKIQSIANEFDSAIYPLVTENFYATSDIDGNGVVSILLADLGGYAAGYITPADFYTKQEYSQSNFRDLLYVQKTMPTSDINSTVVHEFQHLVHANRNILIEGDWNSGDLSYRWIDEGLAMAAQHMYEGAQTDMISVMTHTYYNGPIRDGNSFLYWDYYDQEKVYSDYAMAYVFI